MGYPWLKVKKWYWIAVSYVLNWVYRAESWLRWMP